MLLRHDADADIYDNLDKEPDPGMVLDRMIRRSACAVSGFVWRYTGGTGAIVVHVRS